MNASFPVLNLCTSLVSLLSPWKINNILKSKVSFVVLSLVAPLSWQDNGIKGQSNIQSNPLFHVDHGDATF
jgi:hypothetical protein